MAYKCQSCGTKTSNIRYCDSCVSRYNLSNEDAKSKEALEIVDDLESLYKVNPENYNKAIMLQNQTIINLLSVIATANNPLITTTFVQVYKKRLEEEIKKL
jgi:hypothetical protein